MKRKRNKTIISMLAISILVLSACHSNNKESDPDTTSQGQENQNEIVITRDQFEQAGMKLGGPELSVFTQNVNANGYISAAPNGKVKINTLVPGRLKKINIKPGDKISKGQLLFSLEGSEIIQLQQDYAESYNQLVLLKSNYERIKELAEENIAAKKDLLIAETDYNTMLSKKEALRSLLVMVNIDPSVVGGGSILPDISVYSPIAGYITELFFDVGEYVEPHQTIVEIIDPDQLQLNISVFKQDIDSLAEGQTIRYYDPDRPGNILEATLNRVGKTIDPESRTINCTARLKQEDRALFINNTFVETTIITCYRQTYVLPQSSIINEDGMSFVLVRTGENDNEIYFIKTPVNTGMTQGGFVEITDTDLSDILVEGVYNLTN